MKIIVSEGTNGHGNDHATLFLINSRGVVVATRHTTKNRRKEWDTLAHPYSRHTELGCVMTAEKAVKYTHGRGTQNIADVYVREATKEDVSDFEKSYEEQKAMPRERLKEIIEELGVQEVFPIIYPAPA